MSRGGNNLPGKKDGPRSLTEKAKTAPAWRGSDNVPSNLVTRFTPYEIQDCLFDKKRNFDFLCAINETVKKGDVVVDAGSGSGVLGLFAAKAGAKRVYCIGANPRFIEIIKENARLNGFSNVVRVIHGDATGAILPSKVDVIICESQYGSIL